MKQSGLMIVLVLTLSACGNKNGMESATVNSSPPPAALNPPAVVVPPVQSPVQEKPVEPVQPTVVAVPPAPAKLTKPAKINKPVAITKPTESLEPVEVAKPVELAKPIAVAVETLTESVKPKASSVSTEPLSHDEGLALAKKSGCLMCHKIEAKLVGPAWSDVSKRYKDDPEAKARLVTKVKKGGKGNWTEVTGGAMMPPNFPRVSEENIEKLVTFVLSL